MGISSTDKIEIQCKQQEGFHHGLLHVKTHSVHFLVTHLTPYSGNDRLKEATAIVERVQHQQQANELIMLVGDLNSLSPLDDFYYWYTKDK